MGAEMKFDPESIPIRNYRAWRRRYGDYACVVMNNRYFELDEITDTVWMNCDGRASTGAIATMVEQKCKLRSDIAVTATCLALLQFRDNGLVSWSGDQVARS
jgi:hypothetical protein